MKKRSKKRRSRKGESLMGLKPPDDLLIMSDEIRDRIDVSSMTGESDETSNTYQEESESSSDRITVEIETVAHTVAGRLIGFAFGKHFSVLMEPHAVMKLLENNCYIDSIALCHGEDRIGMKLDSLPAVTVTADVWDADPELFNVQISY